MTMFYPEIKGQVATMRVNKYIRIMFNARDNLDEGVDTIQNCYPTYTPVSLSWITTLSSILTLMKEKPASPVLTQ